MSGFSSKCLVRISEIVDDMDNLKVTLAVDREIGIRSATDATVEHVTNFEDPDGDGLIGYLAQDGWCGDSDSAIFGCEEPLGLLRVARSMKGLALGNAISLFSQAGLPLTATVQDIIALKMDNLNTYYVYNAAAILDGRVNVECENMFYSPDGIWKPWPDENELKQIEAAPQEWAVIEILFLLAF